jgi:hypothetical protein
VDIGKTETKSFIPNKLFESHRIGTVKAFPPGFFNGDFEREEDHMMPC